MYLLFFSNDSVHNCDLYNLFALTLGRQQPGQRSGRQQGYDRHEGGCPPPAVQLKQHPQ